MAGTARALRVHARLEGALFLGALPLVGYWFAFWDHGQLVSFERWGAAHLLLITVWTLGHVATMWLNAALDRDEDDVLWGRATPVPEGIERYAYGLLALALAISLTAGPALVALVTTVAVLGVLYSHPWTAWKGHAWLGPASNVIGYGLIAPASGLLMAGLPLTGRSGLLLILSAFSVASTFFAAQAFQEREDRLRGYRTFVVLFGPTLTLRVTRALLWCAVVAVIAAAVVGVLPRAAATVLLPFLWLDRFLQRWLEQPDGGDSRWARGFLLRFTAALLWGVVVICAVYMVQEWQGTARGGLGTTRGHPSTPPIVYQSP